MHSRSSEAGYPLEDDIKLAELFDHMPSYTRQIADFASNIKLTDIPNNVIARAKRIVLDGLGCGLYASNVRWVDILVDVIRQLEPNGGQASIWGRQETASAVNAALVNGTMVQGYELDDSHSSASIHSCSTVLPAAFAASEHVGTDKVSGARLLLAIIVGFEIGPRVSFCMDGKQMSLNGWHAPAIHSSFPAAVASGIILGLNSEQFLHALGISGAQASGLLAAQLGSMVKRMQCAKNSQGGLYAALLAARGFTGIEDVFEEKHGGFCTTFSHSADRYNLPALVDGLGTRWETMNIGTKMYACKASNGSAVTAIKHLMKEQGLKANDVDAITIGATESAVVHGGWWPYEPRGVTAAQMHVGFCVAMQLIEGDVFVDQMVDQNVSRPDLVELANRVRLVRSVERERKGIEYAAGYDVEVRLRSGKVLRKTVDFFPGSAYAPVSDEEIVNKFRRLASKVMPDDKVQNIQECVEGIEQAASVSQLTTALRND